ncbi:unnamed protein product [Urochloa humidicola]
MVVVQCIFAAMTLWVKAAFAGGMSPMVFVVYRQAVATLVLAPIALISNRSMLKETRLEMKGFFLVFMAALFGATVNQNLCYQGLHLGTSSLATTMTNLIPAITFAMALAVGQERVNIKESSSSSKWVMGALFLIGSSSCWSLWLILQAPNCKSYMDPLTLSAWTCFLSTLQSAAVAFFLLPDRSAWRIHSLFELSCYIFAVSVFGSGVVFYLQSWCISMRGPLYSAMFTPLCTVLTTALSAIVLHEELHIGSLLGAVAVVAGLYVVLWGKAEDARKGRAPGQSKDSTDRAARSDAQFDMEDTTLAAPLLADAARAQAPS